ncbi:hypothetical protein D3C79_731620 [compost metagenome]
MPGNGPRRHHKGGRAQASNAAELDAQQPIDVPQALTVAQLRPGFGGIDQPTQPQAALRALQIPLAIGRVLPNPRPGGLQRSPHRQLQLNVQGKGLRLLRIVDMGLRQTVLRIERASGPLCTGLLTQQLLVDTGLLPVTGMEVVAQHPQIHRRDPVGLHARQQRACLQGRQG